MDVERKLNNMNENEIKWKEMNWIKRKCEEVIRHERTWRTWIEMKGYAGYVGKWKETQDIGGNEWK